MKTVHKILVLAFSLQNNPNSKVARIFTTSRFAKAEEAKKNYISQGFPAEAIEMHTIGINVASD